MIKPPPVNIGLPPFNLDSPKGTPPQSPDEWIKPAGAGYADPIKLRGRLAGGRSGAVVNGSPAVGLFWDAWPRPCISLGDFTLLGLFFGEKC